MLPEGYTSPTVLAGTAAGTPVLLGLSGGADSASLLDMLAKSGENVSLCHVNHCIRGEEADRDEAFCRSLAEKYGLEITVFRENVPEIAAASSEGLEEAARRIRYERFSALMAEKGIGILCTAHNADDNAETVLFNILRGSSARGGCGIPRVRSMPDGRIVVRPLLRVSRARILGYCAENGLEYVTDSTNSDDSYSRNRIRLRVLPELRAINPDAVGAITRFSDLLRCDCDWLDSEAEAFLDAHPDGFGARELDALPDPVAARVIASAAKRSGARPEKRHVDALLAAARRKERTALTMPGSVRAAIEKNYMITFSQDKRTKKKRG